MNMYIYIFMYIHIYVYTRLRGSPSKEFGLVSLSVSIRVFRVGFLTPAFRERVYNGNIPGGFNGCTREF